MQLLTLSKAASVASAESGRLSAIRKTFLCRFLAGRIPTATVSGHPHSRKLVKKIKTPETRRFVDSSIRRFLVLVFRAVKPPRQADAQHRLDCLRAKKRNRPRVVDATRGQNESRVSTARSLDANATPN
jgi:hypothetical protein